MDDDPSEAVDLFVGVIKTFEVEIGRLKLTNCCFATICKTNVRTFWFYLTNVKTRRLLYRYNY